MPRAVSPKIWGPSGWAVLHRMSFCFRNLREASDFYNTLVYVLPCPKCRRNLATHIATVPLPHKVSDFPEWTWKLHNRVSDSLSYPRDARPSFAIVREKYAHSKCNFIERNPGGDPACEATFLLALAESHPGGRAASDTYIDALSRFIHMYLEKSDLQSHIPGDDVVRSRSSFRTWVQKLTKSRAHFGMCS
jgi:hypothetical protein